MSVLICWNGVVVLVIIERFLCEEVMRLVVVVDDD